MRQRASTIGTYIHATMVRLDLPRKAVCERARISESMMSRVVNGERDLEEEAIFEMGFACGMLAGKGQSKGAA